MFTLLLPRDINIAGNLEMAEYDTRSDDELMETAVVCRLTQFDCLN
jgi:hypothetical protein